MEAERKRNCGLPYLLLPFYVIIFSGSNTRDGFLAHEYLLVHHCFFSLSPKQVLVGTESMVCWAVSAPLPVTDLTRTFRWLSITKPPPLVGPPAFFAYWGSQMLFVKRAARDGSGRACCRELPLLIHVNIVSSYFMSKTHVQRQHY